MPQGTPDYVDKLLVNFAPKEVLIERSNRWARIENVEVTTLPVKEHEYGFGERSGE